MQLLKQTKQYYALVFALAASLLAGTHCAKYAGENGFLGYLAIGGFGSRFVAPELLSFGIVSPSASGALAGDAVSVTLPAGSAVGALIPIFQYSGARILVNGVEQISGISTVDFSAPVVYTVVGSDASTRSYTVTVSVLPQAPTVSSAVSLTSTTVRIVYSLDMNASQAGNTANYKIIDAPGPGACADNTSFTAAAQTADFTITGVSGSGTVYDFTLSTAQTTNKNYSVVVNKSAVSATSGTALDCPNSADFIGNERIKLASATCASTTQILLRFSKPVRSGVDGAGSAECSSLVQCAMRYSLSGATDLGGVTSAALTNGVLCAGAATDTSSVCLTHTNLQTGGVYAITGANGLDGDGFNNVGNFPANDAIRNIADTESLNIAPGDRIVFEGCGADPTDIGDGPLSGDPFADASAFGYVQSYANRIYVGPNQLGNAAVRFYPDGSTPQNLTFAIAKDTTGTRTHANFDAGRDGGIPVPPYVTFGHAGCSGSNASIAIGCGPDNENGRGLLTSGNFGGTEYLFATAARTAGNNDYLYYTADTDSNLNFNYLDASDLFDTCGGIPIIGNRGTEDLRVFNNRLYWSLPGVGTVRPYLMVITALTPEISCTTHGDILQFHQMTGVGRESVAAPNLADRVGGVLHDFNNRLYYANSGSITNSGACNINTAYSAGVCEQTGGIVRSNTATPTRCTGVDTCATWVDITPSSTKYRQFFSDIIGSTGNLTPAQQPIPNFETYNSNVYFIRNACTTSRWDRACTGLACTDDQVCPAGQEIPQLWKCVPGGDGHCDAADWSLVAENGASGITNMGVAGNSKITFLKRNGSYLYVGFDNTTGAQMYRTNVTNPGAASDFSLIGTAGFGSPATIQQFFDGESILQSASNYLFIAAGLGGTPVNVYIQANN
ncbi:MAG: hypothetical protein NXI24_06135 [bacterium]|nr:hypothetical protein [bacterium]